MRDEQLRELERRWKESGTAEDGAAWLAARLRSGAVDPLRLQLAAMLGSEAAGLHCDRWPDAREAWVQAAVELGRMLRPRVRYVSPNPFVDLFELVEAWLANGRKSTVPIQAEVRTWTEGTDHVLHTFTVKGRPFGYVALFAAEATFRSLTELPRLWELATDILHDDEGLEDPDDAALLIRDLLLETT